jgi:hypothetical protein
MLLVVMTTSIAALFTLTALTSAASGLRQGVDARHEADVRSLADAGASRALGHLTDDRTYTTHPSPPAIDRAWVLATAQTAPLEVSVGGEFAWIVPSGADALFGIGFVPNRAAPKEVAIVRVAYTLVDPSGFGAVASAAALTVDGNAMIAGLGGSAHSNGALTVEGTATISGAATASGTFTRGAAATVGPSSGGGRPTRALPVTDPRSYRSLTQHDLCPDTTVRVTAATPCTGAIAGNGVVGWQGWTVSGSVWTMSAATATAGALYVYRGSARITSSPGTAAAPWLLTLITESLSVGGLPTNGDVTITGGSTIRPFTGGVGIVAHRDIAISGASTHDGLVIVGEQVSLSGSTRVRGQILATGATSSATSPVTANRITGTARIDAETAAPQVTGGVQTNDWVTY